MFPRKESEKQVNCLKTILLPLIKIVFFSCHGDLLGGEMGLI